MWVRGLKLSVDSICSTLVQSHPMWVRGLKPIYKMYGVDTEESHPMWVRGLKLALNKRNNKPLDVAPYVGAWIETPESIFIKPFISSHPMWVRGLKH